MRESVEEIEYKGVVIKIYQDDSPESPREWENLGQMICSHRRYNMGDVQYNNENANNWRENFAYYVMDTIMPDIKGLPDHFYDYETKHFDKVWKWIDTNLIALRVRMYEHSGVSISVSDGYPYNDRFDAMQLGMIYTTRERILNWFEVKRITADIKQKVIHNLTAEVELYNMYLNGEVYGYEVEDTGDACWGYYGTEDCIEAAKECVDSEVRLKARLHMVQVKAWIKGKVPLIYRRGLKLCLSC